MSVVQASAVAVLGGVLIATQASLLGPFGRAMHPLAASVWINVAGAVVGVLLLAVLPVGWGLAGLRSFPWGLLGGVCGVGIVAAIGAAVTPLGVGTTLAVATGTQLLVAFGVDALGLAGPTIPLEPSRLLGAVLLVAGAVLVFGR